MRIVKGEVEDKDALKGTLTVGGVEYVATEATRYHCATIPVGAVATMTVNDAFEIADLSPKIDGERSGTVIPPPKKHIVPEGKDAWIIRQTCIKCASEIFANKKDFDDRQLLELANKLSTWVMR